MPNYTKDRSLVFRVRSTGSRQIVGNDPNPTVTTLSADIVLTRTVNGQTLPDWRSRMKNKVDATTEFSGVYDTYSYKKRGRVEQKWQYNANPSVRYEQSFEGDDVVNATDTFRPKTPTKDPTFVDNLARAKFYQKLDAISKTFDGLVFAGELTETLRLIKRPHEQLMRLADAFLDKVQKKKRYSPKSWKKELGGAWLEQAFGWKPLINDVASAVSAYEQVVGHGRLNPVIKVSAGGRKFYEIPPVGLNDGPGGKLSANNSGLILNVGNCVHAETVVIRYRAGVYASTDAPKWHDPTLWGFSPEQFIPSAWELLPWSFLADYVTNIGELLQAACSRSYRTAWVNRTIVQERTDVRALYFIRKEQTGINPALFTHMYMTGDIGPKVHTASRKIVSRTKLSAVPLPSFQLNWDLTDGQLLNVAALISQASKIHPQNPPRRWHR